MTAFNSKWKYEKLAVRFDWSFTFAVILRCCFAEDGYEMYIGLLNTLVRPLFWSLNLLFGGAHWCRGLFQTPSTLRRRNFKTHTTLFLRIGLRSRVIRHENGAFRKRSSNRRNFKTPALSFRVDGKHFKTDLLEYDTIRRSTWFPWPRFPETKI